MKKIKFILLLCLIVLPMKAKAATGTLSIDCGDKTKVNPGENFSCTVKGTTDVTVTGIDIKLTGTNLNVISVTKASVWGQGDNNDPRMAYYDYTGPASGTFDIATVVMQAAGNITTGGDATISVQGTHDDTNQYGFTDSGFAHYDFPNISKNIRIASTVNTLSGLTISAGTLTPEFSSSVTSYAASTEETSITITATKTDENSTISGDTGTKTLNYGANNLSITVTSETGASKTYSIIVTRPDTRDTNNYIKTLSLNDNDIEIIDGVVEYSYQVESSVTKLTIEATLDSEKSSFVEGYGPRTATLEEGENTIEIRIKAENEEVQTYTLKVIRGENITSTDKSSSTTGTTGSGELSNPKTGSAHILVITGILIISLITFGVIYYMKMKEGKKSEQK